MNLTCFVIYIAPSEIFIAPSEIFIGPSEIFKVENVELPLFNTLFCVSLVM